MKLMNHCLTSSSGVRATSFLRSGSQILLLPLSDIIGYIQNANIGIFSGFLDEENVKLIGVEGGGISDKIGDHAKRLAPNSGAVTGVHHGFKSKFLLDKDGNIEPTHSISAGLDYPGVGPELAYLQETGRLTMISARDEEVIKALAHVAKSEGILFALESSHAAAEVLKVAPTLPKDKAVIVNMSGRGDKDIFITAPIFNKQEWIEFLGNEIKN